ncbi:unnamed protein product [Coregonus sp. 'balchen']|nr:unnamed protein product [Coregonus sp. 'balchen']
MEQTVWLQGVLCLQVCLLSTTALPGQDRRTAAFQTNQAMISRIKRQEKVRSECKKKLKMCRSCPRAMTAMIPPAPSWSLRIQRQEKFRSEFKKKPEMYRSRPGAMTAMSPPAPSWCISMEQTVWLLGVLCLQVCLLSTTALPGQDRRTAAFQTNQAMGGSSPFLPGPPPQVDMKPLVVQLRAKRHEESVADGDKRKGCSGHRPGSCSVVRRPPPPKSSRTKRQERTKDRRKRPYRPGALAVISDPTVPVSVVTDNRP